MIVRMVRVRIAGPRSQLDRTLTALQDLQVLHVDRSRLSHQRASDAAVTRERRHIEHCLADAETTLERLRGPVGDRAAPLSRVTGHAPETVAAATPLLAPADVRRARRLRRRADSLALTRSSLEDERSLLMRYREFFQAFETLVGHELTWPDGQAFYVVLRAGAASALSELRRRLEDALGGEAQVLHCQLSSGELAVLILASARVSPRVSSLLSASGVEELPAPAGIGENNLLRALPAIRTRLEQIPEALRAVDEERRTLARAEGAWLSNLRGCLRDRLVRLDAQTQAFTAEYLFVIEGWVPAPRLADLEERVPAILGPQVVVSTIGIETWGAQSAPVALHNPALFRPFEILTRMLPLPKYGTIDPTPFVGVFFPAFFGLMLGDVGYGLALALLALLVRRRSQPGTTLRSASTVALACSSSAIAFGLLFGEFFGSLGHRIGLYPLLNREEATLPFLGLALALGAVHVVLGVVLAGLTAWRGGHRREAVGRGVALAMLVLITLSLLAAFEVLPRGLFTPLVVAILVAFTVLVALEGIVAVIDLLSTLGHILSYARIMALGTASLMLAVVANKMVGALGSVLVGAVFALLFHLVNFAIGLFSPTIHALRLHYVEFFGQFFSPGGTAYRPLGHWHPSP